VPTRPLFELFDLENDPHEFNHLGGGKEFQALERERKAALQEWLILERDYLPLPIPPMQ
jgi:N-sulfoglucosamine sulfohydrolase